MSLQTDEPRARKRSIETRERQRSAVAVIVALLMLGGVGYGAYTFGKDLLPGTTASSEDFQGEGSGDAVVVIEKGDTTAVIARTLERAGVVASSAAFLDEARARSEDAEAIQPGQYGLRKRMSAAAALDLLLAPESRLVNKVTVPEGMRLADALKLVAKQSGRPLAEYKKAAKNTKALGLPSYADGRLEGFLFPATYEIEPDTSAAEVLKMMVSRFKQAAKGAGIESGNRYSPYQLVVIASLVEAEAGRAEDFGKVARVVYNRLDKGMLLQFDSTVNYALDARKVKVTEADLEVDSPYNTYRELGLPPGPIGSPGDAALKAARTPPKGKWLYFVTTDLKTGETKFTDDYDTFLRYKAELKRNGG